MTKDELHNTAQEQNNQATAGTASVRVKPQLAMPGPFAPKPPFGMPIMPVAKNIKVIAQLAVPEKERDK
jgi:hypothetical protein